ncbi:MAG TPA: T9SS type A sorting domain-containing protein [Saprospiraceae bacterium]|nr:T9SS type A sorting domain-containing protein [Saprospiraceae bacterium]
MKKVILLFIAYIWVATSGYSQIDFVVSSADFASTSIPVGGTTSFLTFISINETEPGGELAPGCLDIIISLPTSGAYKPTGGAAAVSMTGFGPSFMWVYDPVDNALYGNNIVTLVDGDGGLITVSITGFSLITSGVTSTNASDALNCTTSNEANDNYTGSLSVTAPLPVKLTGFKPRSMDCEGIHLSWATESEVNSKGFNVERSLDGREFEKVAFIESNSNSTSRKDYSFEDVSIKSNGTYYYRLVELDLDGSFKISETISHEFNCFDVTDFSIYPNPTSDKLNVNFNGVKGQVIQMDLLDAQGKLVRKVSFDTTNPQELSVKDIAPGFYSLQFNYGDQVINRKFIKVE